MVLCYLQICKSFSCTLCALMGLLTWWLQWLHNFKLSSCINWALEFKEEQTTASSHLVSKPNSSYHHIPRTQANCLSSRGECWHPKRSGFCVRPNSKTQLSNWLFSNCTPSFTPTMEVDNLWPPPPFPLWIMECPCDQPHLRWLWLGTYNPSVSISPIKCFVSQPLKF